MTARTRPGLTRDLLVDAALRLLDEVGLERFTVRRLADELGVQSPALYWHVRTKRELLDAMADRIIRDAGMGPPRAGESWAAWLRRRAHGYRDAVRSHRDGVTLVSGVTSLSAQTMTDLEDELEALVIAGFTPSEAFGAIAALSQFTLGFLMQEQAERPLRPSDAVPLEPPSVPPTIAAALRDGASSIGDGAFERGLDVIIAGVAATRQQRVSERPEERSGG